MRQVISRLRPPWRRFPAWRCISSRRGFNHRHAGQPHAVSSLPCRPRRSISSATGCQNCRDALQSLPQLSG
ncbi:hypothetical protein KCP69_12425 [Salmonella enterica subsp. enterica]|nr:hypothetical protein KCP69_12425 [Salmonella enterica subsp. enterica]